jgi:hypothetical protein
MAGVRCTCRHGRMMDAFDLAKEVWLNAAEAATSLYATELAEYKKDHPMPQLKDFMAGQY